MRTGDGFIGVDVRVLARLVFVMFGRDGEGEHVVDLSRVRTIEQNGDPSMTTQPREVRCSFHPLSEW